MIKTKITLIVFIGIILLGLSSHCVLAQKNKPLLIPNKKNLYQRVLSLPKAKLYLHEKLSEDGAIPLPAFSIYYVYQRIRDTDGHDLLQVGLDWQGHRIGWIKANKTITWNQGLTLVFRKPIDHDRVLLFKDKASLQEIIEDYDLKQYQKLYEAAREGKKLKNSPVAAIQPATDIDMSKNFYLLPIHDYEDIYLKDTTAKLIQISSIPLTGASNTKTDERNNNASGSYTAGIVFTIDATISMHPYIDRTRQAVQKIFDTLQEADLLGQVHFGLVAFRDNTDVAPGIEYLTHRYVSLKQGENAATFLNSVKALQTARVPSKGFIEDSYAGIYYTLQAMDWSSHAARHIILVTDAGARGADDPLSSTGLDAAGLNQLAQEKKVAIFVLHLLTPDRMANHEAAARQYRRLSDYPGIGSLYYAVPAGDVQEFGQVIDALSGQITPQIEQIRNDSKTSPTDPTANAQLTALRAKVAKLDHALRFRYLPDTQNEQVPDTFNAWLLDKDFRHPEKKTVDVCVLLTRDQLSDLHDILKQVLETAELGLISPKHFLDELKSIAATIARDPERLGTTTATTVGRGNNLADMGFLREYIEDLPYTGEVMNLVLDDWQSWNTERQVNFVHRLEEKISYYRALHEHTDLWVSLDGGAIDGDAVFPVPLDMLP